MVSKNHSGLKVIKLIGDIIFVNFGFVFAFLLRFGGQLPEVNFQAYLDIMPWISIATVVLFQIYALYGTSPKRWQEIQSSIICVSALLFLVSITFSFMSRSFAFPRTVYFIAFILQIAMLSGWRYFVWRKELTLYGIQNVIIVGRYMRSLERAKQIEGAANGLLRVAGLIVDIPVCSDLTKANGFPVLGNFAEIESISLKKLAEAIFICEDIEQKFKEQLLKQCLEENLQVYMVPNFYEIMLAQAKLEQIEDIPIFSIGQIGLNDNLKMWKRLMDLTLAVVLLVPALPIIFIASIAIKITSPGPALFFQERVSENGKVFRLIKLRTMIVEAEKNSGPVLATTKDPRVTTVGRFLRVTRIDELPQLINVLMGEMSFIGPRPERPYFVEQFTEQIPGYEHRHSLKAGITGLAQIAGNYSTSPGDKLRYDLLYAKNYSPLMDLQILFHTLKVMLMRDKAS